MWIIFVIKDRAAVHPEQGGVYMHARAGLAEKGFRHERGDKAMFVSDRFYQFLEDDHLVSGTDRVAISESDLMLSDSDLVMSPLRIDAEYLEGAHDLLADIAADVSGTAVEV